MSTNTKHYYVYGRVLTLVAAAILAFASCDNSVHSLESGKANSKTEAVSLAAGTSSSSELPLKVNYPADAPVMLQGGAYHHCAYFPEDGNVVCWGVERSWDTDPDSRGSNTDDYMEGDAIGFDGGGWNNCVLLPDGTTKCWGYKGAVLDYTGGDAVQVATGYAQSCVLTEAGTVNCYGLYIGGTSWQQLEIGNTPVTNVEWITMSEYAVCAKVAGESSLRCKGWNVTEPIWDVQGTPTPNAGGHYAICVATEEGDVDCMNNGYNETGQTAGYYGGDVVDVGANFDLTCYTTESGDVSCFGRKDDLYANQYFTALTGVDAIAVSVSGLGGRDDICYANSAGEIECYRDDTTPPDITPINEDTTPPELTYNIEATELWPVNHKMRMVVSGITASDVVDPDPSVTITVYSDEPQNGRGDGNTSDDWNIVSNGDGSFDVEVRAERNGNGSGRTYTIAITATDGSGNAVQETVEVSVPHSKKKR